MNIFIGFLLIFGFLMKVFSVVDSIKCYQCQECNDHFDTSKAKTVDCSGVCTKGIAKIVGIVHAAKRDCSNKTLSIGCQESTAFGIEAKLCVCDHNLCNGNPTTSVSIDLLILVAILSAMWSTVTF